MEFAAGIEPFNMNLLILEYDAVSVSIEKVDSGESVVLLKPFGS